MADFTGANGANTITGAIAPDTLNGLDGADILDGGDGADTIIAQGGTDLVYGGGLLLRLINPRRACSRSRARSADRSARGRRFRVCGASV